MSAGKPKVPLLKAFGISATMVGISMLGIAVLQPTQLADDIAGMVTIVGVVMLVAGAAMLAIQALATSGKD